MAIEDWIDDVATLFEIASHDGGKVRSYHYYDGIGLPESLNDYPLAWTVPISVLSNMSKGPRVDLWRGKTEFHFFADVGYDKLPDVLKYARRIRDAIASGVTLGAKVNEFRIDPDNPRLLIPAQLRWSDDEPWHWGAVLPWEVKENVSDEYSFNA